MIRGFALCFLYISVYTFSSPAPVSVHRFKLKFVTLKCIYVILISNWYEHMVKFKIVIMVYSFGCSGLVFDALINFLGILFSRNVERFTILGKF